MFSGFTTLRVINLILVLACELKEAGKVKHDEQIAKFIYSTEDFVVLAFPHR